MRNDDLFPSHPGKPYGFQPGRVDEYRITDEGITQHENDTRRFVSGSFVDALRRPFAVFRGGATEPVGNLFKRGVDNLGDVQDGGGFGRLISSYLSGSKVFQLLRGSTDEPASNLFKRGVDNLGDVQDGGGFGRLISGYLSGNKVFQMLRGATDEPASNLFKRGVDTLSDVQDGGGYGRTVSTYLNAGRVNFLYRSAADEPSANLFKRGVDTLQDVQDGGGYGRTVSTYLSGGKPFQIYRGTTDEPASNLFKRGVDTLGDVQDGGGFARVNSFYVGVSGKVTRVQKAGVDELGDNLFKRGVDTLADVQDGGGYGRVVGTYLTAGKVSSVYRASVDEPSANLFKRGVNSLDDVQDSTSWGRVSSSYRDATGAVIAVLARSIQLLGDNVFVRNYHNLGEVLDGGGYKRTPYSSGMYRLADGIIIGPNATWGGSLEFGNGSRSGANASFHTTNGDLHINSRVAGNHIFLNYYTDAPVNVGAGTGTERFNVFGGNASITAGDLHIYGYHAIVNKGWNNTYIRWEDEQTLSFNSNVSTGAFIKLRANDGVGMGYLGAIRAEGVGIINGSNQWTVRSNVFSDGGALFGTWSMNNGGLDLNRQNNPFTSIAYYTNGFNAWRTYMSQSGTNIGPASISPPSGNFVTSWSIRNIVEDQQGYGWIWEAGAAFGTTPHVIMELASFATVSGYPLMKMWGDVLSHRPGTNTGVYYFVDTAHYLYYTGSQYQLQGGNLYVPSGLSTDGGVVALGAIQARGGIGFPGGMNSRLYPNGDSAPSSSYINNVQIREWNLSAGSSTAMDYAPRLAFHWGGVVASSIAIEPSGRIGIFNNPGTGYENFIAKDIYSNGDMWVGGKISSANFTDTLTGKQLAPVIVSTAAPSGTAPNGTLWVQVA